MQKNWTASMSATVDDSRQFNAVIYDEGHSSVLRKRKGSAQSKSSKSSKESKSTVESDSVKPPPIGFKLAGQVVSFQGGKRGLEDPIRGHRIRPAVSDSWRTAHNWKWAGHQQKSFFVPPPQEEQSQTFDESDYSILRNLVAQLLQAMCSSHDDADEFERLRRRAHMLRKRQAFVGLFSARSESPDTVYARIQAASVRHTKRKNARQVADELIVLMQDNVKVAAVILSEIDRTARVEGKFMDSNLSLAKLGKRSADEGMEIHFVDLDWMTTVPDYKSVALMYRKGYEAPENLQAMIAPTDLQSRSRTVRRGAGRKKEVDPPFSWDRVLENYELVDLIKITSALPEFLIDEVIQDYGGKVSNFR
jgi:hypothetical protein